MHRPELGCITASEAWERYCKEEKTRLSRLSKEFDREVARLKEEKAQKARRLAIEDAIISIGEFCKGLS